MQVEHGSVVKQLRIMSHKRSEASPNTLITATQAESGMQRKRKKINERGMLHAPGKLGETFNKIVSLECSHTVPRGKEREREQAVYDS